MPGIDAWFDFSVHRLVMQANMLMGLWDKIKRYRRLTGCAMDTPFERKLRIAGPGSLVNTVRLLANLELLCKTKCLPSHHSLPQ